MARLLYAIGKGYSIDFPSLIQSEMKKGCDVKTSSLPFGTLVTEICMENGVRIRPEMEIQKSMRPLNKGSFKRSLGHSGGPVARQEVPPAQGGDDVQEELDREEKRELEREYMQNEEQNDQVGPSTTPRRTLWDVMLSIEAKQDEILRLLRRGDGRASGAADGGDGGD